MHKVKLWFFVLVIVSILALSGQAAVRAQPGEPASPPGYALGAWGPNEKAGRLIYPDVAPQTAMSPSQVESFADEVIRLINAERRSAGLYPYKANPVLATIGEQHSSVMRDQACFSHQCPGEPAPDQRACNAGYGPYGWGDCFIGETIAAGYSSPASVVAAWMNSSGHRAILMHGKLREIGVGYVEGGPYGHYWTADFGSQPDVLPVFINYDDPETDTQQVTLTLTNEEVSGWGGIDYAQDVMISNDPNFASAQWERYALHKAWTLAPGNGEKAVYVKYKDPNDNETISIDDIVLNIPVEFELALSSDRLIFYYEIGQGFTRPPTGSVNVENGASSSPMDWGAIAENKDWLGFDPAQGVTPDKLAVSVANFTTEQPGISQSTILVTSPQTPGTSKAVTVTIVAAPSVHQVLLPLVTR